MSGVIKVKSGSKFEEAHSFCRAVRAGNFIFSSNSSGRNYATGSISSDPCEQMLHAIENINYAFSAVGASVADAVKVQISFARLEDQAKLLKAFAVRFEGIDPALTLICQPHEGDVSVEVEITAYKGENDVDADIVRLAPRDALNDG